MNENKDYQAFNKIYINHMTDMFTNASIRLLADCHIITLADLFKASDNHDFILLFTSARINKKGQLHDEILGTTRLLKCEYLKEDPIIDFAHPETIDYARDLGLSTMAANILNNNHITMQECVTMASENDFSPILNLKQCGEKTSKEIIHKINIVYDYYMDKTFLQENDLSQLFLELKRLNEENQKIINQIGIVQNKIERILENKGKIR